MLRELFRRPRPAAAEPAPGPDALVAVYARAEHYYLEPFHRTRLAEAGFWIGSGEVTTLSADAADAALGSAVLEALALSRVEVPVPPRGAKLEAGLFRAMGVRSRRASMAGTLACNVEREPARSATAPCLRVEALANGGTSGDSRGYRGLPERHVVELPLGGADATMDAFTALVGRTVRESLHEHATAVG